MATTFLLLAATAILPPQALSAKDSVFTSADALRHYAQGRLLEEQGQGPEAMGEFYRALTLDPASPGVARRASELAARLGDHPRSLELADRALRVDAGDARALWLRGAALFNLERPESALQPLQQAARLDSNRVEYLQTLARVAEHLERIDVVLWAYRRAVQLSEFDGELWFQLAAAEARTGQFGTADSALARAMDLNPLRPGARFLNGWIQESLGRYDEAISAYEEHVRIHPSDITTRIRLLNVLVQRERWDDAYRQASAIARERPGDPQVLEQSADLAFRSGNEREAWDTLELLERMDPDEPDGLARRVAVLARNGHEDRARQAVRKWNDAHPGDYRGAAASAQLLAIRGEDELAIAYAQRAVETAPDSLPPRIILGQILQSRERYEDAEAVWLEATKRRPDHTGLAFNLAFCREQLGDLDGAESVVRGILAREPANPDALNFLGYLFADHDIKLEEAEDLIGRALEAEPDNGAFVDSMGWVYYRMGRLQEARGQLERAVKLTGGDPVVHEHLGDVYKDLELHELAHEQYRLSLTRDGSNDRVKAKLQQVR